MGNLPKNCKETVSSYLSGFDPVAAETKLKSEFPKQWDALFAALCMETAPKLFQMEIRG